MSINQGITAFANQLQSDGDCVKLAERSFYDPYFSTLTIALRTLSKWFQNQKELGQENIWIFHPVIARLLTTIGLLRLKQQYDVREKTALDLNESGFLHSSAINQLSADILRRDEELASIPDSGRARQELLDVLLVEHREDEELLWNLARRIYFEQLGDAKIFEQFNLHSIVDYPAWECKKPNRRPYLVTWGCFDQTVNLPMLHMMIIEQDNDALSLNEENEINAKFLSLIRAEGSRAVELGFMGTMIDGAIESVHPKFIRRIQIGPFHSHEVRFSKVVHPFIGLIDQQKDGKNDFVLEFEIEDLLSVDENVVHKGLFKKDGIRQVFLIPKNEQELKTRRISGVHKYLLLPHHLLQCIDWSKDEFKQWLKHHKVAIDSQGEIYDF